MDKFYCDIPLVRISFSKAGRMSCWSIVQIAAQIFQAGIDAVSIVKIDTMSCYTYTSWLGGSP
jgi:hypothetical protein